MSTRTDRSAAETITGAGLRAWPLPAAGDSKYSRGLVLVIGGAARSPGAAILAGVAALRVGAGRLTLAVGRSVAGSVAVAVPESGVIALDETAGRHVMGSSVTVAAGDIRRANAVLVGPGLDDADEAERMLRQLPAFVSDSALVVLDAFALGVIGRVPGVVDGLGGRLVLTPNKSEATLLLHRELGNDLPADLAEISSRYRAVVSCSGLIAAPDGRHWASGAGGSGLATSGSGDVLAGAITGLCARGADPAQAAVWGTHAHGAAGDRLAERIGPLGFLARELCDELPRVLVEIGSVP